MGDTPQDGSNTDLLAESPTSTLPEASQEGARPPQITRLLQQWRDGDSQSWQQLVEILYHQLRTQARSQLRRLRPGQTLGTTALVNEAYLRLQRYDGALKDHNHFSAVAATAMRQILVDHARQQIAKKRGAGAADLSIDSDGYRELAGAELVVEQQAVSLLDLDRALQELGELSPRLARIVEYRFFAGMTEAQIAEILEVTDRTVRRDWIKARTWLYGHLAYQRNDQASKSPLSKPSAKSPSSR